MSAFGLAGREYRDQRTRARQIRSGTDCARPPLSHTAPARRITSRFSSALARAGCRRSVCPRGPVSCDAHWRTHWRTHSRTAWHDRRVFCRQSRGAGATVPCARDCALGRSRIAAAGSSAHVARLGTIAIIPTLIAAGSVAHEAMTAIKSGSAGDDCASLSISTALDNALAISGAFKCVLFSSDSVTRASAFETVLRAARLGSARGRVG